MSPDVSFVFLAFLALVIAALVLLAAWLNARRLRRRNEALARLAEGRAEALELALGQAEAANAAKGDFLAVMSHELRTPVHAILGLTELLLDSSLGREQQDQARSIQRAGRGLLCLVNDILDFSKIEAGKLSLRSTPFDLRELVEDLVDLHAAAAGEKELELVLHWAVPDGKCLLGDPDRLRQVLMNLLGNALKFTTRGHVLLKVEGRAGPESLGLRISVIDTGCGVHPDKQEHLFEAFTQEDTSITRRFGGTGLGLAICKRLVEGMEGAIGFTSDQTRGSCFWFTLDLPWSQEPAAAPGPWLRPGFRVLVVEGLEVAREALCARFRHWGVDHGAVESWRDALNLMKASEAPPFNLILASEGVEAEPGTCPIPLVLLCPMHLPREARALARRGFAGILRKPVLAWELWEVLDRAGQGLAWLGSEESVVIEGRPPSAAGFTVLVGEDNPLHREVARRMLEGLGGTVFVAVDGREVLAMAEARSFDCILLDGQMPALDGLSAARALRSQGVTTLIVAMTAHALEGDRERFLAAGMDAVLTKPFSRAELARAIQAVWPDGGILPEDTGHPVASQEPLDHEGLLAEERRSPGSIRELVALYCVHAPVRLAELRRALTAGDFRAASEASHALTGSAACIRAGTLAALGRQMEILARTGSGEGAQEVFPALEAAYKAVWSRLEPLAAALEPRATPVRGEG
jgi:signal transduction histidine kinase/CheY-like chemotaxis protein/HPt (histidine-containing phosphotransfer) domain-containing protein